LVSNFNPHFFISFFIIFFIYFVFQFSPWLVSFNYFCVLFSSYCFNFNYFNFFMVWNRSLWFFHVCLLQGNLSLITRSTSFDDKLYLSSIFFKVLFKNCFFFIFWHWIIGPWASWFVLIFFVGLSLYHISYCKLVELTFLLGRVGSGLLLWHYIFWIFFIFYIRSWTLRFLFTFLSAGCFGLISWVVV